MWNIYNYIMDLNDILSRLLTREMGQNIFNGRFERERKR